MTSESLSCSVADRFGAPAKLTIYLDNMAATPIDPRVAEQHRAAMMAYVGNAHSAEHPFGTDAQEAIDRAGTLLLRNLGSASERLAFMPGASAALWLAVQDAISRVAGRKVRVAATAVEHPALLAALRHAEAEGRLHLRLVNVDGLGAPMLEDMESALRDGVDLLCAMAANNEVGTVTDLSAVSALAERYGARLLVDASQAAGRIDMAAAVSADLLVVSGAKIYGPRRVGALIGELSAFASRLNHDLFGSPDAPAAIALAGAMELRNTEREADETRLAVLRDALQSILLDAVPGLRINGSLPSRLAGSLHVSTPHLPGEAVVGRLWGRVAVSTGAACQSGVPGPSHVLKAMDIPGWAKEGAIRIGIGRFNTADEVASAGDLIAAALGGAQDTRRFA